MPSLVREACMVPAILCSVILAPFAAVAVRAASVVDPPEWVEVHRMKEVSVSIDRANVEEDDDGVVYLNVMLRSQALPELTVRIEYEVECATKYARVASLSIMGRRGPVAGGTEGWQPAVHAADRAVVRYVCD